jgi:uncharacterized protein (AIM24 family)
MKLKVKVGGLMRMVSGESLFKAMWENNSGNPGFVALTPNLPGTIIAIDLDQMGQSIKCKRDAFMASIDPETKISIAMLNTDSCLGFCCSGMGFIMQNITGRGTVSHQEITIKYSHMSNSIVLSSWL